MSQDSLLAHLRRFPVRAPTQFLAPFLAGLNSHASLLVFAPALTRPYRRPFLTNLQTRPGNAVDHHRAHAILPCQCLGHISGAGISTCSPSPTTSVLGLGPDLPWADEPSPGNLGLSTAVFLARLSLLIPALSLLYSPPLLSVRLQPIHDAPLPLGLFQAEPEASVACFSPDYFRRTITRPVSYYALFE